nr:FAD-dependent oxidoreductase [Mycobacterium ulcerans]
MTKRIAIVGAGAAGLSAAVRLRDRGYDDVTVLEGAQQVGGKACSVEVDGRDYDLGAVVITPQYPNVLAARGPLPRAHLPAQRGGAGCRPQIGRLDGVGTDDRAPALLISRLVSWVDDLWCRAVGAGV